MKNNIDLKDKLKISYFTKKNIPITYRALNHYDQSGLLLSKRNSNNEWRKFNGFEIMWLNIVIILREIGLPLKIILKLKNKIFEDGIQGTIDKANYINKSFEDEVILSIYENYELYILIFYDMSYTFHDSNSLHQWHNGVYKNEPHINIPLTNIIKDVLINLDE